MEHIPWEACTLLNFFMSKKTSSTKMAKTTILHTFLKGSIYEIMPNNAPAIQSQENKNAFKETIK